MTINIQDMKNHTANIMIHDCGMVWEDEHFLETGEKAEYVESVGVLYDAKDYVDSLYDSIEKINGMEIKDIVKKLAHANSISDKLASDEFAYYAYMCCVGQGVSWSDNWQDTCGVMVPHGEMHMFCENGVFGLDGYTDCERLQNSL